MLLLPVYFLGNYLFVERLIVLRNVLGLTVSTDSSMLLCVPIYFPYQPWNMVFLRDLF